MEDTEGKYNFSVFFHLNTLLLNFIWNKAFFRGKLVHINCKKITPLLSKFLCKALGFCILLIYYQEWLSCVSCMSLFQFEFAFVFEVKYTAPVTFWYSPIFQYTQGVYTNGIPICVYPFVCMQINFCTTQGGMQKWGKYLHLHIWGVECKRECYTGM